MSRAYAIRRFGGVELVSPYSAPFVDALKRAVPSSYRSFDPAQKSWTVEAAYVPETLRAARNHFDAVELLTPAAESGHRADDCLAAVRRVFADHAKLHVLPGAPPAVVQGAYRALVREHHPDLVGSSGHAATVALNASYERLRGAT